MFQMSYQPTTRVLHYLACRRAPMAVPIGINGLSRAPTWKLVGACGCARGHSWYPAATLAGSRGRPRDPMAIQVQVPAGTHVVTPVHACSPGCSREFPLPSACYRECPRERPRKRPRERLRGRPPERPRECPRERARAHTRTPAKMPTKTPATPAIEHPPEHPQVLLRTPMKIPEKPPARPHTRTTSQALGITPAREGPPPGRREYANKNARQIFRERSRVGFGVRAGYCESPRELPRAPTSVSRQ